MHISLTRGHCGKNEANFAKVTINNTTLWFSYETIVAFHQGNNFFVRENVWGSTTGKHLNFIDGGDHDNRVSAKVFESELDYALKNI